MLTALPSSPLDVLATLIGRIQSPSPSSVDTSPVHPSSLTSSPVRLRMSTLMDESDDHVPVKLYSGLPDATNVAPDSDGSGHSSVDSATSSHTSSSKRKMPTATNAGGSRRVTSRSQGAASASARRSSQDGGDGNDGGVQDEVIQSDGPAEEDDNDEGEEKDRASEVTDDVDVNRSPPSITFDSAHTSTFDATGEIEQAEEVDESESDREFEAGDDGRGRSRIKKKNNQQQAKKASAKDRTLTDEEKNAMANSDTRVGEALSKEAIFGAVAKKSIRDGSTNLAQYNTVLISAVSFTRAFTTRAGTHCKALHERVT